MRVPDETVVPAGRCSTYSRNSFPSTVTVVKNAGARSIGHEPHLAGDREAAPRDDGPGGVDHLPDRGRGRPDLLAGHDLLRRRREGTVRRVQQGVARHEEGAERGGQHRDDDGDGRRQDEPGAEGHVSRST